MPGNGANDDNDNSPVDYKNDQRRYNRGASQRKSYKKEEKLAVIKMKDKGMSYEEISKRTGYSRVNMEKWCSAKGREAVMSKIQKAAALQEKLVSLADVPPKKRQKASIGMVAEPEVEVDFPVAVDPAVQFVQSTCAAPALSTSPKRRTRRSTASVVQTKPASSAQSALTPGAAPAQSQSKMVSFPSFDGTSNAWPAPPSSSSRASSGTAPSTTQSHPFQLSKPTYSEEPDTPSASEAEEEDSDGDLSDEEQLLKLVIKEQRRRRREQQTEPNPIALGLLNKRKALEINAAPPPETGYFPHKHPVDPALPRELFDKDLLRTQTIFASDITMSVSDAMLMPDYTFSGCEETQNISMAMTLQATRPVLTNTKFFKLVRPGREAQMKALEERPVPTVVQGPTVVTVVPPPPVAKANPRVLEELCDSDSDQEKEDSAMLMILGE